MTRLALTITLIFIIITKLFAQVALFKPTPNDEYIINISSLMYRYPLHLRYADTNSIEFTGNKEAVIFKYDIKNKSISEKKLNYFKGKYYLYNWKYLNDTTIILAFSATYLGHYHDKSVALYSIPQDSVLSYYNFNGIANIITKENEPNVNFSTSHFIFMHDFELNFGADSSVIVGLGCNLGSHEKKYNQIKTSNLIKVYPSSKEKMAEDLGLRFINTDTNSYTYKIESLVGVQKGENLVLSYGKSNNLYILDLKTSNITSINAQPTFLFPTRGNPNKSKNKILPDDYKYRELLYDSSKKTFYRVVEFPSSMEIPITGNYPKHGLIIMNDSLTVTGWVELPFGYTAPIATSPNGILAFDKLNSEKQEQFILTEFTLKENGFVNSTPDILYKEVSSLDAQIYTTEKYLSELNITLDSSSKIIIIPIENSCPYNVKLIANALKNGAFDSSYTKIFLYDTKDRLNDFINRYSLNCNDTYYFDSYKYKSYFNNLFNINLIKFKSGYWPMERLNINELVNFIERTQSTKQ